MCWQRFARLRRTAGPCLLSPTGRWPSLLSGRSSERYWRPPGVFWSRREPDIHSGYDDGIADRLAEKGIGVLPPDDRAVLTLVLLFSVAIPRAEGKLAPEAPWTRGHPVARERLYGTKVPKGVVKAALQRLQDAGITRNVGDSVRPGPQFDRLTPTMSITIFEGLLLLADPHGPLADAIRRRRASSAPASAESPVREEKHHGY